jgi:hypothetical protein
MFPAKEHRIINSVHQKAFYYARVDLYDSVTLFMAYARQYAFDHPGLYHAAKSSSLSMMTR